MGRSRAWLFAVASIVPSCGRFEFDPHARDVAPGADAPDGAVASSLIHQYSLVNSYADDLGGSPLVGQGGAFVGGGYQFGANQGLSIANAVPTSVYTIDVTFSLDVVTGYRKVIDFKALGSDAGLYVLDNMLQFVVIPITGCPGNDCYTSPAVFNAMTQVEITLTRDATGNVVGYVDKLPRITFVDDTAVGAFDTTGAAANFFLDDGVTSGTEVSSGLANRIRIYSTALTAAQVAQ